MRKIFREAANRRGYRRILSILLAAVLCFGMTTPAMAADKAKTIRLMTTEGTVVVTNSSGESQTIWEEMRLYSGWHVITGAESYAYLRLDDSKGVKLDASTEVEVRSRGRKLELLVDSGNIYFGVSAPLESDETLNIRTSTMAMGIRGTSGWVDAVEEGRSRIHILEGVVTGTVTDPVSGQSKSTTIHGGEYADFYTYDASVPGDKVAITRGTFDRGDISGYVLKELVGQDELIEKIYDDSGIDLRDLTYAAAAAVQASDEAAARAAAASQVPAAQEAVEPYETDAEKTPVWSVGGSGGGDGGSAGSYTSPEVIVIRETETVEVPGTYTLSASGTDFLLQAATGGKVAANDDGTYKVEGSNSGTDVRLTLTPAEGYMVAEKDDVTVYHGTTALSGFTAAEGEPGSITGTANISKDTALSVDGLYYKVTDMDSLTAALASHDRVVLTEDLTLAGDLTIPSGKTLVVFTGNTVRIDANAVLQIEGTLVNKGMIENYGTIANRSAHTLLNEGTIKNHGDIENGDGDEEGRIINEGDIINDGASGATITNASGSQIENSGSIENSGKATINNAGRLENTSSGTIDNTGAIANTGDLVNDGAITGEVGVIDSTDGNLITTTDAVNENEVEEPEKTEVTYNVIIPETTGGSITADPSTDVAEDAAVILTVKEDSGYQLAGLSVFGADGTLISTGSTFTMPKQDVLVVASFEAAEDAAETWYTVSTFVAEGGTLTADLAKAKAGETVTLTATAAEGYAPSGIKVVSASNGNIITLEDDNSFTMPAGDVVAFALFTKVSVPAETYRLTIAETANGTVSADRTEAEADVTVVLTVMPHEGFELESLTVTDKNGNAVTMTSASTFTMPPSDVTVTATFQQIGVTPKYSITVNETNNGSVKADADESIAGLTVVLTVTPNEGYELESLTVTDEAGEPITMSSASTFTMPPSNVTVTATFKVRPVTPTYTITVSNGELGSITPDTEVAEEGRTVVLTVDVPDGYELDGLTITDKNGDPVAMTSPYSFTMPASDVMVTSTINAKTYTLFVADTANGTVDAYNDDYNWNIMQGETHRLAAGAPVYLLAGPFGGYALKSIIAVTLSGESLTLRGDATANDPTASVMLGFDMPAEDVIVIAVFEEAGYKITIPGTENGLVVLEQTNTSDLLDNTEGWTFPDAEFTASEGETVCLHIVPACVKDENNEIEIPIDFTHQLKSLVIMDEQGHTIDDLTEVFLDDDIGLYYQFTMPAANVIVLAGFASINDNPGAGRDFVVTGGTEGVDYTYVDGALTIRKPSDLTITNTNPQSDTTFGDYIVVDVPDTTTGSVEITLVDLLVKTNAPALTITQDTSVSVNIYLTGYNRFTILSDNYAILKNNYNAGAAATLCISGKNSNDSSQSSPPFLYVQTSPDITEGSAICGNYITIKGCAVELQDEYCIMGTNITIGASDCHTTIALRDLAIINNEYSAITNYALTTLVLEIDESGDLLSFSLPGEDGDYLIPRIYANDGQFEIPSGFSFTVPGNITYDQEHGTLKDNYGSINASPIQIWSSGRYCYTKASPAQKYDYRVFAQGQGYVLVQQELITNPDDSAVMRNTLTPKPAEYWMLEIFYVYDENGEPLETTMVDDTSYYFDYTGEFTVIVGFFMQDDT